jgi:hypothetical protein
MMKKKYLKALLAILLASVLALQPGCKLFHEEFDITGVWELTRIEEYGTFTCKYIFIGTKEKGIIQEYPQDDHYSDGVYSVNLDQVYLTTRIGRGGLVNIRDFVGSVISNDSLLGTIAGRQEQSGQITLTWTGTWRATR